MRCSKLLASLALLSALWSTPSWAVIQCAWMGNANYTASPTDICVLIGTPFTAPRTLTLPKAGATQLGQGAASIRYADGLTVIDIANAVSSVNTLTIAAPAGGSVGGASNVINGAGSFSIVYPISGSDWFLTAHGTEGPTGPAGGDLAGTYPNPTLAAIGAAAGPIGSATVAPVVSIDTKGRVTALTQATITPAIASITGLGTGVATALATNVGSAGAPVLFNGAAGTPTSLVGTNITGTATGLTAGTANAVAVGGITGLGTGVATALAVNVGSAGAFTTFNGALGTPSSGVITNLTGTCTACTANTFTAGSATNLTSGTLPGARLPLQALTQGSNQNPTGTTATGTGVMMGLGTTCALTTTYSTRVQVIFTGNWTNSNANAIVEGQVRFGTGGAPANAVAQTGTAVASAKDYQPSTGSNLSAFTMGGIITGLSLATAYWFDISALVSAGTGTLTKVDCMIAEL